MFQSTRPRRGATPDMRGGLNLVRVSIHAPPKGRDGRPGRRDCMGLFVSIHAPPKGRDQGNHYKNLLLISFNPRAPEGARRVSVT